MLTGIFLFSTNAFSQQSAPPMSPEDIVVVAAKTRNYEVSSSLYQFGGVYIRQQVYIGGVLYDSPTNVSENGEWNPCFGIDQFSFACPPSYMPDYNNYIYALSKIGAKFRTDTRYLNIKSALNAHIALISAYYADAETYKFMNSPTLSPIAQEMEDLLKQVRLIIENDFPAESRVIELFEAGIREIEGPGNCFYTGQAWFCQLSTQ